ncbi:putative membrane protein [Vibrio parahaemolyticus 970107]|nr:putative membrane protein [Vibrio parahaemolyticus 970107]
MAFLVWGWFSVYGVQFELCGSVAHTLIGRYVFLTKRSRQ